MKIAQHGAVYGVNFGDVLIQRIVAEKLKEKLHADVFFPRGSRSFAKHSKQKIGQLWSLPFCDGVVFGPGGYLGERRHDQNAWNKRLIRYHGYMFKVAKFFKKPIFIFGVGVGPLSDPNTKKLVKDILEYASYIQLRDDESANYAVQIGIDRKRINIIPDVALSIERQKLSNKIYLEGQSNLLNNIEKITVGLHLPIPKEFDGDKSRDLRNDIVNLVESRQDINFVILFDGPKQKIPDDFERSLLNNCNIRKIKYTNPEELLLEISNCKNIITTKLHVGICGVALGVNPICIFTHMKVKRFCEQIGRVDYCVDILDYDIGWLKSRVLALQKVNFVPLDFFLNKARRDIEASFDLLAQSIIDANKK